MSLPNALSGAKPNVKGSSAYPDVDSPSCQLLGPTALIVQGLMGILVILSLVYKRHREKPMRPWRIWLFDVSKQVVGQMFVHGVNVLISDIVSQLTSGNACVFYFLNILIDTTLGVAIIYAALHAFNFLLSEKLGLKGFESGVYGNPPSFNYWCRQAAIYVLALTTMKFIVIVLLALFPIIFTIGEWLLSWTWTGDGDALQVVFTMGLFPIVMNILQFWLIDSIVKASAGTPVSLEINTADPINHSDREPLFNAPSDDEGDDSLQGRSDIENQLASQFSRASLDSGHNSRPKSFSTGFTTPEEYKSSVNASEHPNGQHSYPPSVSSSFASASSSMPDRKGPKEAKNLLKQSHRRKPPSPLHIQSETTAKFLPGDAEQVKRPTTPVAAGHVNPAIVIPAESTDWAVSWDDSDDWANQIDDDSEHVKRQRVAGVWNHGRDVQLQGAQEIS